MNEHSAESFWQINWSQCIVQNQEIKTRHQESKKQELDSKIMKIRFKIREQDGG